MSSLEKHFQTIVIGVGSMGSAACYYLAMRGQTVLGLEQFESPHEKGSHAGQSRIVRKAYFEHPDYVPLLDRAYDNWRSLEKRTGRQLFHRTGISYFGKKDNENIIGIRTSARLYNIPIKNFRQDEARMKFPAFQSTGEFDVIFEPDAGFVTPENTIRAYIHEAQKHGAVIQMNTPVLAWKKEGAKIRVVTTNADFSCDKLIVTSGAWTARLLPQLKVRLQVARQLLAWVSPANAADFIEGNFPCWFVEDPDMGTFYGFPIVENSVGPIGMKLAHHFPGVACGPDEIAGKIPAEEEEKLRRFLRRYLPAAGENIIYMKNCLYTYSPDHHFIIDQLPGYEDDVIIACGFSGHGFKFVPVVGEVLADLAIDGETDQPIGFLRMQRFK